jgi:23S rRNA (cytidine1920-2'-O)/16S rRNA (cytidine1409-2'-O)-methyltransferase
MKKRLDILMVERGLAQSRTQAQALIMAGQVSAEGRRLEKPGLSVGEGLDVHVKDQPRYVGRAGDKLASVAETLGLDFRGKVVLDVGSSTGGFTDFALQHGAVRVYCVDVGTGQLAYKLRQDERVVAMEQTDIRDVTVGEGPKALPERADMAVMDVSFISLMKVLEPTAACCKPGGLMVAMAKPQFEAGKALADRYRGVIPMGAERDEVLEGLRAWMAERFEIVAEADSGVAGTEGNVERFFLLKVAA